MAACPSSKVQPHHQERLAIIYVRQSTMAQVQHHRESTERQYALQSTATSLGWPADRVHVIDRDLGLSGAQATTRPGFQDLVTQVSLGRVGAIFGLEISRLARSSADLQRLLQLCALFDTLVVDADGIYDLRQVNDRLILGFKGTVSEAELSVLHGRLMEAKEHKAAKGTLRFPVPVGYVWPDGTSPLTLDPDETVQSAIRDVFALFATTGTAYGVVKAFGAQHRLFPKRAYGGAWAGQLRWRPLTHSRVLGLLKNPSYTGTYVFGRYHSTKHLDAAGRIVTRSTVQPSEQWPVRIPDHHPAYITWAQFEENLQQLRHSQTNAVISGPAREGQALLPGLVICGQCGRRMSVRYTGNGGVERHYECKGRWDRVDASRATCQNLRGEPIDAAVVAAIFAATTPEYTTIALAAWDRLADQWTADDRHWHLVLERAQYEADLAQRPYDATDPANRLVARTLEARWNAKLEALQDRHADYQMALAARGHPPTPADREFLAQLPDTLPRLWQNASIIDRKRLLRALIEDITLDAPRGCETMSVGIRWRSQRIPSLTLERPQPPWKRRRHHPETVERVRQLAQRLPDLAIADQLNADGDRTPDGRLFTRSAVCCLRLAHHIAAFRPSPPPETWTVAQCAQHFGVSPSVVYTWIQQQVVPAQKWGPGQTWAITVDGATEKRCHTWIVASTHLRQPEPPEEGEESPGV